MPLDRVAAPLGNYLRHGLTDWLASRYAGASRSRTVRRLRRAGRRVLPRLSEASTPRLGVAGGACRSARSSPAPRAHSARSDFRCSRKGAGSGYRHLGGTASRHILSEPLRERRLTVAQVPTAAGVALLIEHVGTPQAAYRAARLMSTAQPVEQSRDHEIVKTAMPAAKRMPSTTTGWTCFDVALGHRLARDDCCRCRRVLRHCEMALFAHAVQTP
jgi:hypothetical protein